MYKRKPSINSQFLTSIEKVLISDEILMRLLYYPPMGWDESKQKEILDPLDERLPNIVNENSDEYWEIVEDKVRKGYKRMSVEHTKSAVLYMHEGRDRTKYHNNFIHVQELIFKIVVHEEFEIDNRISDISSRISYLIEQKSGITGGGKIRFVASNPREAPVANRLKEDIYSYNIARIGRCC